MKYLLLLVLLLPACWTGAVEETGVHETTLMNGKVEYYVEVLGPDLEVTKGVYNTVKTSLENIDGKLVCDFERLGKVYDDIVYCKVK